MIKLICSILVLLCLASPSLATVNTARPRVWIDSTELTRLRALVPVADGGTGASASAEWTALKAYCATHAGANTAAGYRGESWYQITISFALAYLLTQDEDYATDGIVYLDALLDDKEAVGDNLGYAVINTNQSLIGGDSNGWTARTFGSAVAIARDWFDGSTALNSTIIDKCGDRLAKWINFYQNNSAAYAGPASSDGELPADNFYAGYFSMLYLAGVSIYGDTNYNSAWLATAATKWNGLILPFLNDELDGGDWIEGWSYGSWASREYVQYLKVLDTGTDEADPWSGFNWHDELIISHLHMLYPQRDFFCDDGSMSGSIYGPVNSALVQFLTVATPTTATNKGLGKWYSENTANNSSKWENMLWTDTSIPAISPSSSNMSLSLNMGGHHTLARSDYWSSTTSTIVDIVAKPDTDSAFAEGNRNAGEVKIGSRGEELIIDGDSTETEGQYSSVPSVEGTFTYHPYQEWWQYSSLISTQLSGAFYAKVIDLDSAYDGKDDRYQYPNVVPALTHYTREVLFIHPDYVIVYDNAQSVGSSNEFKNRVYFAGNPNVGGQTVIGTVGSARVFTTAIGQTGTWTTPTLKTVSTRTPSQPYYTDFDITGTPTNNQMFLVHETADSSQEAATAATLVDIEGAKGLLMDGNIALFTDSQTGADISTLSYTADATTHYIADLPVNSSIEVTRGGAAVSGSPFDSGDAGVITFSAASGSATYEVNNGGGTPSGAASLNGSGNGAILSGGMTIQ